MNMKRVAIEDLKANIDAYVEQVREGETIVLCDGDEAVAELGPVVETPPGLRIRWPSVPPGALLDLPPIPIDGPTDVVAVLREDRDRR